MTKHALTSSSFVINAMYTYSFGNSLFLMAVKEGTQSFSYKAVELSPMRVMCGMMMLIMTLRYFFGNNNFLTKVMDDPSKGPWVRLYHFCSILTESLLLFATSYLIPYPVKFVFWFTALMGVEVLWYFLTRAVDKTSVVLADPAAHRTFFIAEMTNAAFVISVVLLSAVSCGRGAGWLGAVLALFLLNSAYDAYINMPSYMSWG